jgi:hypothetical protein
MKLESQATILDFNPYAERTEAGPSNSLGELE